MQMEQTSKTTQQGAPWNLLSPPPPRHGEQQPNGRPAPSADRFSPADTTAGLGLLKDLAGSWRGEGFNLIARPAFHYHQNLYLQLNRTREHLKVDPIGSPIPNRGFAQPDIALHGLTYLQSISDLYTGSALHIEPGIWVQQPNTVAPPETAPPHQEVIARMGSIPHGNAILAQGVAQRFTGTPVLSVPGAPMNGSKFQSFNSTPIAVAPTVPPGTPPVFSAEGSSAKGTAAANPSIVPIFTEYDLGVPEGPTNPRTPLDTADPPLSTSGITQQMVNDPIVVLRHKIEEQIAHGYIFEGGTVLNVATEADISFFETPNCVVTSPFATPTPTFSNGGAENMLFLFDNQTTPPSGNAQTAIIYATFWIETLRHKHTGHTHVQLQYAQMVTLNFPVFKATFLTPPPTPPTFINLGWPHITVGTLQKSFG